MADQRRDCDCSRTGIRTGRLQRAKDTAKARGRGGPRSWTRLSAAAGVDKMSRPRRATRHADAVARSAAGQKVWTKRRG